MENLNNIKLCYTKKATILPHLISILICGIICLILIPLPILPFLPFVEVNTSKLFLFLLFLVFDLLMGIPLVYLGIIVNINIIKQKLKINKILPENFCFYNSGTKDITVQVGKYKFKFNLSELKDIIISPPKKIDYVLCDIKVSYDKIKELCFKLKNKDEITLPIPFLKDFNRDIETIKSLK